MAHKLAVGAVANGRDSRAQRLGVKVFEGQTVTAGAIIIRQVGNKFWAGTNVYRARDFTLHAAVPGVVKFDEKRRKRFDGSIRREVYVSVVEQAAA